MMTHNPPTTTTQTDDELSEALEGALEALDEGITFSFDNAASTIDWE